jgi:hypothetical protein
METVYIFFLSVYRKSLLGGKMSRRNGVLLCSSVCSKALTDQRNQERIREREQQQQQRNNFPQPATDVRQQPQVGLHFQSKNIRPVVPQPGTTSSNSSHNSSSSSDYEGSQAPPYANSTSSWASQQPPPGRTPPYLNVGRYDDFTDGRAANSTLPAWRPLLHARQPQAVGGLPPPPPPPQHQDNLLPPSVASRHVQFASDLLNTSSGESATTPSPHRSPSGGRDVRANRPPPPEIFTFGEADRAAQKLSQLGITGPQYYHREELDGGRPGYYGGSTELGGGVRRVQGLEGGGGGGGGRHVHFEEEGRRDDGRSPFPVLGSNYSTIV